jgi:MGT family glycosyltransferase
MTHFGIISPPVSGHLNPFSALGRELQQRGHQVTFFQMPDIEAKILAEGLNFWPIGQSDHPLGSLKESIAQLGQLSGLAALRFTVKAIQKTTNMICRDAPQAIKAAGVDALLVDQTEPAGATVADYLGLPYITICCAMAINREPKIPPIFTPWNYQTAPWASLRNQIGYGLFDLMTSPIGQVLRAYRQQWKLKPYKNHSDSFSSIAQLSQQPSAFDFPRTHLPSNFYYLGPFRNPSPQEVSFPYERLTGQSLVYTSLGTLQNTKEKLFHQIATACADLDVQLVLAHGGGMSDEGVKKLPGKPIVVSYAPQWELLAKASLTITHAGLNTVLDSLSHGVPLVAIPITYEQPAIAARLRWVGAGEVLSLARMDTDRLKTLIERVLREESYRHNAAAIQLSIERAGGVIRGTDLIESSIYGL